MLGDTAVAVHPDDPRFKHLIGKTVDLPLTDDRSRSSPTRILVDPTFGTGCVKVTPAHDPNDYQTGLRHKLPMINLLNPDGTYNENAGPYAGLDRHGRAQAVVADLKAQGLLETGRAVHRPPQSLRPEQDADRAVSVGPVVRADGRRSRRPPASPSRRWMPSPRAGSRSIPSATPRATLTGWAKSATGASAGSSGGGIGSRSGICETCADLQPTLGAPSRRDRDPDAVWRKPEAGGWLICARIRRA